MLFRMNRLEHHLLRPHESVDLEVVQEDYGADLEELEAPVSWPLYFVTTTDGIGAADGHRSGGGS